MIKPLAFMPYCSKPFSCPIGERQNQRCLLLEGKECEEDCSVAEGIMFALNSGVNINDVFIIDKDEYLFSWLKKKADEGYNFFVIGVGCEFAINYAWDYVRSLGFSGNVCKLRGDVCNKSDDYEAMEEKDIGKKTYFILEEMKYED